jgi:hypothetical protein
VIVLVRQAGLGTEGLLGLRWSSIFLLWAG